MKNYLILLLNMVQHINLETFRSDFLFNLNLKINCVGIVSM
jgi:hypothetical protein